jgi:DNA (cytosine-5)-methyltransferase 1
MNKQLGLPSFDDDVSLIQEKPYVEEENLVSKNKLKIVDLFAGIGGFHYGISAAAAKINLGVQPLLVSEIETSCQEAYSNNFKCEVEGDINKISLVNKAKTADILTAGFPCQPFSNSGLKLGLADPRGQFYFRIEEIIKHFNTKAFILENVPGIKGSGGGKFISELAINKQLIGKTMHFLEENLKKLKNYKIKWLEINSSLLGSPQVRKRVYIIGIHKDFTQDFEIELKRYKPNPFISIVDNIQDESLELSENQDKNLRSFMISPPSYKDGMRRVGQAYLCKGGNVGQGYHAHGMVPTLTKVWAGFLPIYFPHKNEPQINLNSREFYSNSFYGKGYIRKASVRETARLQGFPESFIPHQNNRIAYEHSGNAVNAKIVREIADNILRYIIK